MIDWKRKLTSRKFWVAVSDFVAMLLVAFKCDEGTAAQIAALILAGAAPIAYILGEAWTDATQNKDTE